MRKNSMLTVALLATVTLSVCSEIEDGVNRMDGWEDEKVEVDHPAGFVHPNTMHTNNDIGHLREIVTNREQPGYGCYEIFASDTRSRAGYTLQGPYREIYRENDNKTRPSIQSKYGSDFNAAYQNSIVYAVAQDEARAKEATEIPMAYASTLEAVVAGDQPLLAGIMGVKSMYAAEMIRYLYPKEVTDENFARIYSMFKNIFVPIFDDSMATPTYTNGSQGASVGVSYIATTVLFNDLDMYKETVDFYCNGIDNGAIRDYINGETGQCQRSKRDQAHAQLGLACLSMACEIACKQDTDLYEVLDNRLQRGCEYTV